MLLLLLLLLCKKRKGLAIPLKRKIIVVVVVAFKIEVAVWRRGRRRSRVEVVAYFLATGSVLGLLVGFVGERQVVPDERVQERACLR